MSEKTKVAIGIGAFTLIGYYIGKINNDTTPGVIIGGMAGKLIMDIVMEE